jgi:hypothetical protein
MTDDHDPLGNMFDALFGGRRAMFDALYGSRRPTKWDAILHQAAAIVDSYDTPVTLRQLFYRLVAAQVIPNTTSAYKRLSAVTAEARRAGTFPPLSDLTRRIEVARCFDGPDDAHEYLERIYRRDRTEGQDVSIYLGVEKHGLVAQLSDRFADLGVPIVALGGYSSQTFVDDVAEDVSARDRLAVLLYAGDFDPSGEDIDRDFVERADCFDKVVRVALTAEQVTEYDLPPAMGKATDSRAAAFVARHGELVQVELDALPPDVLLGLYQSALDEWWDTSAYEAVRALEEQDREEL